MTLFEKIKIALNKSKQMASPTRADKSKLQKISKATGESISQKPSGSKGVVDGTISGDWVFQKSNDIEDWGSWVKKTSDNAGGKAVLTDGMIEEEDKMKSCKYKAAGVCGCEPGALWCKE